MNNQETGTENKPDANKADSPAEGKTTEDTNTKKEDTSVKKEDTNTKKEDTNVKKKGKGKFYIVLVLTLVLATGAGVGIYFAWQSTNYITTDNARVTANLIHISSSMPGTLERFTAYEGRFVEENEVLGWIENGEAMRSPVNGLVIHTNAVQDQSVLPMEPLAVIADTGSIHIQANIEETNIMQVRLGQPAIVTIDGLGNRQFNGYVAEIGHITQAELTGTALFFNTGGTFTRVTHLIPIKINIIDDVDLNTLIGVNARVRIPVGASHIVLPEEFNNNIVASGVVESVTSRNVYTTLGFKIDRVYAEVGDRVTEGQVLAVLDTAELELTIAQQRAAIEQARQSSQNTVEDTRRMLNEAAADLANNTNAHILSAEAALSAAESSLAAVRQNYNDALQDYTLGTNPQIVSAESFLRTAGIELETRERDNANFRSLYAAGILSQEEMRQSENALTLARNQYNEARINYENAVELQQRTLEQLRIALQSATTAHQNARDIHQAVRITAAQDIERLRSHVVSAEVGANLEHMEIALAQLERHLEDSTITAPISGTVTAVIAREGEVGLGRLFIVEDTDNLRVITSFREYDIGRVNEGMEVAITSSAAGDTVYTGIITRINPAANLYSPVVEFEAEIAVITPDTNLRIGMNARLDIEGR